MNREQLYAVLMALNDETLLLPNSAVIEVVAREALGAPPPGAPAWLLGDCEWNNRRVPVVSVEALNGGPPAEMTRRARVVVLHSLGTHLPSGLLAVVAQGYPHLVTLNRTAIKSAPIKETDRRDLVLTRVRIASQEAMIPDLGTIEAELVRVTMAA
ncbi:MAG TPA: chemotaxis protein CheW [Solimonas sp.]|nr:chemotaxis protein CheW [Solimonas sp.]